MTKLGVAGMVLAGLLISTTAFAATTFSSKTPHGLLVGAVLVSPGNEVGVYKIVDGATTCYIAAGNLPSISCLK